MQDFLRHDLKYKPTHYVPDWNRERACGGEGAAAVNWRYVTCAACLQLQPAAGQQLRVKPTAYPTRKMVRVFSGVRGMPVVHHFWSWTTMRPGCGAGGLSTTRWDHVSCPDCLSQRADKDLAGQQGPSPQAPSAPSAGAS